MHAFFPALCVTGALLASGLARSASFEEECESRLPATSVEVLSHPSRVEYDFTQDMSQLTRALSKKSRADEYVLGSTSRPFQMAIRWNRAVLTGVKGRACARPSLIVDLWASPQTVSVANEFPPGSCAFGEIVKHELRHVEANQAQVELVADEMQREMQASLGNRVFYGTAGELATALTRHLQEDWLQWGMARFEEVATKHSLIDSPEEYARNSTMCAGEVRRVIQRKRSRGLPP